VFLNTSSDARLLPAIVDAASAGLGRPSDDELASDASDLGVQALFDGAELERI